MIKIETYVTLTLGEDEYGLEWNEARDLYEQLRGLFEREKEYIYSPVYTPHLQPMEHWYCGEATVTNTGEGKDG